VWSRVKRGAKFCHSYWASLEVGAYPPWRYKRRREEEECFGIPGSCAIVGIIILARLSWLIGFGFWRAFWPLILIIFEVLILAGALYRSAVDTNRLFPLKHETHKYSRYKCSKSSWDPTAKGISVKSQKIVKNESMATLWTSVSIPIKIKNAPKTMEIGATPNQLLKCQDWRKDFPGQCVNCWRNIGWFQQE